MANAIEVFRKRRIVRKISRLLVRLLWVYLLPGLGFGATTRLITSRKSLAPHFRFRDFISAPLALNGS